MRQWMCLEFWDMEVRSFYISATSPNMRLHALFDVDAGATCKRVWEFWLRWVSAMFGALLCWVLVMWQWINNMMWLKNVWYCVSYSFVITLLTWQLKIEVMKNDTCFVCFHPASLLSKEQTFSGTSLISFGAQVFSKLAPSVPSQQLALF